MALKTMIIGGVCAALISLPAQAAVLANGGFETGDLSGWSFTDGLAEVVTSADDFSGDPIFGEHYTPTEGGDFARLTAGDAGAYTILSQAFHLDAAAAVAFDVAFLAFDELPFDDDAYVKIIGGGGQVLFTASVSSVGDYGHTDWTRVASDLLGPGDYVFEAGVRNVDDAEPDYSSQLLIDHVALAVPEPSAWGLMLLGFAGVGATLRRRRAIGA